MADEETKISETQAEIALNDNDVVNQTEKTTKVADAEVKISETNAETTTNDYITINQAKTNDFAEVKPSKGMKVSMNAIIITIAISAVYLLTVGLISGLVFRKINTCDSNSNAQGGGTTPIMTTLSTTSNQVTISTSQTPIYENIRLPQIFQPYNYNLNIKVDFTPMGVSALNFSGTVKISFNLKSSSQEILFHADPRLKISDPIVISNLMTNTDQTVGADEMHQSVKNEYYYIKLNNALSSGNYTISLNYVSTYSSLIGNRGLFAAQYLEDGIKKTMIGTKFEPTDARKAFPCFDEPQLKATYDFTIQHPMNTVALANFNVLNVSTVSSQNALQTTFATTYPMSTYLVAWAVVPNDWGYEEKFTQKDNKPVRVYGRKFAKQQGLLLHAVDIAKKSLDFYENVYFQISDAVPPKIDLIAVPDFPTGAMENWGLIGFRETSLLYSNTTNSAANKQSVSLTIAHEVAHFWFGNLVTCKWWNDLWLNEAMATFLEYKTLNYLYPEWTMYEQVIMLEGVPVMWDDAFPSSHPVEANVETPDQINNVFDSITYSKGQSVLRQLENVVGAEGFRLGLIAYLTKNKYSSGVASEFYNSLQLPSDMAGKTTPSDYMATWLLQMNYPKVEVNLVRTTGMTRISFAQSRFLLTPFADGLMPTYVSPFNYTWQIYLRCTAGGTYNPAGGVAQHLDGIFDFTLFMNGKTGEYISNGRQLTWVKCNPGFSSFYTTKYDDGVYDSIVTVLGANYKAFSIGDRANILHDSFLLGYQGSLGYSNVALVSSYLSASETDYIPWRVFFYHSTLIARILEHRSGFLLYANFATSAAEALSSNWILNQELNNPNDHLKSLLKTYTVEFLCRMQDENCLRNMTNLFLTIPPNYFSDPNSLVNPVPPSIRGSVYRYHSQNTYDYRDWFNVLNIYLLSGDPVDRSNSLSGMSYSRSQWLLATYLEELRQNDSSIIKQDFFTVLNAVARNPSGRHLAWYFYRHYWDELVAKFGLGDRTFGRSIKAITETFGTMFQLDEINEFFAKYPQSGAGEDPRKQSIEAVLTNIFWINYREPDLVSSFVGPLISKKK